MKNQLVLITEDPVPGGPALERTALESVRPEPATSPTPRLRTPRRSTNRPAVRAQQGAAAARDALRVAVKRTTEREEARRQARERALLAAVTQPHLPHISARPGRDAA